MCGIYGMIAREGACLRAPDALERMGQSLQHRGPDGRAVIRAADAAIGVERLRIVDPRPQGDQPLTDPTARVWLACNGEIYNASALRMRYADYPYRSRSDVETILPLFLSKGPAGLAELDGMFALAIWDPRTRHLVLARDRAGEKPLFYARLDGEIWFASEVQALLEHSSMCRDLDAGALEDFLTLGYVREPRTMFPQVRKVGAGTIVTFAGGDATALRYWDPAAVAPTCMSHDAAMRQLSTKLEDAVARQTPTHCPVGVFTSGGVDSSLLTVLAARAVGSKALYTFTVGFEDPSYDERGRAAAVAARLGTRHVEINADRASLMEALQTVSERVAEPLADPAILPTYLLARAAHEHVAVVLSGEGADELFGGYPTYLGHRAAPWFRSLPATLRAAIRRIVTALPTSTGKVPLEYLVKRFVAAAEDDWLDRHIRWFGTGLDERVYRCRGERLRRSSEPDADPTAKAMQFDYQTYLRDGLLTKVDRATMLVSLEARAPYLDRSLTEFALGLDWTFKIRGATTKWLLKRVAAECLPRAIVHRRKRGLSVPIAAWINDGLRHEADRLLAPARLRRAGVLDVGRVQQLVSEHRSGRVNHARPLWALIVFELWRERWLGG